MMGKIFFGNGLKVSMDGRGRALDNIFVERLWRTVKYEYVYLQDIPTVRAAWLGLRDFFHFYNCEQRGGSGCLNRI